MIRPDGLYLHLPEERKEFLFAADPVTFVKYMWGKRAEIIVQLGRISIKELQTLLREAYEYSLPPVKAQKRKVAKRTTKKR